jgi:hypothetical protein
MKSGQGAVRQISKKRIMAALGSVVYKVYTSSSAPTRWSPLEESAHSAEVAFMAQEIGLLCSLTPELDSEG